MKCINCSYFLNCDKADENKSECENYCKRSYETGQFISKDKIKEKIEVLRMKEHYDYIDNKKEIQVLQELLEKEG